MKSVFRISQAQVLRALAKDPAGPFVQAQDLDPIVSMPVYGDLFGRYAPGFGWARLGQGIAFCCSVPVVTLQKERGE